jgi:hypothetical protein
VLTSRLFPDII